MLGKKYVHITSGELVSIGLVFKNLLCYCMEKTKEISESAKNNQSTIAVTEIISAETGETTQLHSNGTEIWNNEGEHVTFDYGACLGDILGGAAIGGIVGSFIAHHFTGAAIGALAGGIFCLATEYHGDPGVKAGAILALAGGIFCLKPRWHPECEYYLHEHPEHDVALLRGDLLEDLA